MYEEVDGDNQNPLRGKCPIECLYCFVQTKLMIYPGIQKKYSGDIMLDRKVLSKSIKDGKTRFLCSCIDLFADGVPLEYIAEILDWAARQNTTWIIQTKNPLRQIFLDFLQCTPVNFIMGTTIETNRYYPDIMPHSHPHDRIVHGLDFVTIEPIMAFDHDELMDIITTINPKWVWIGANTAHDKVQIPEPTSEEVNLLIDAIKQKDIEVRIKSGLKRIARTNKRND